MGLVKKMKEKEIKQDNQTQLQIQNLSGETWTFKMKKSTKLGKVFKEYMSRTNVSSPQKLRFIYKGRTLTDEDTPESLGMEDNARIELFSTQVGGSF
ncbi:small ubiquitin-related modifier [Nematocida sp. AWRm77]|nr:small ubiquitin-related modifier [Nematocida sp. AWRm77]